MSTASHGLASVLVLLLLACGGGLEAPDPTPVEPIAVLGMADCHLAAPPLFLADGTLAVVCAESADKKKNRIRVLGVPELTDVRPAIDVPVFVGGWSAAADGSVFVVESYSTGPYVAFFWADGREPSGGEPQPIDGLAVSPDGTMFAVAQDPPSGTTDHGRVDVWALPSMDWVGSIALHEKLSALSFTPDGRALYSLEWRGQIGVWDVATRTAAKTLAVPPGGENQFAGNQALAFSGDGKQVAIATEYGGFHVLSTSDGSSSGLSPSAKFDWDPTRWVDPGVYSAAWSPVTGHVLVWGGGSTFAVIDPTTGAAVEVVEIPDVSPGLAGSTRGGLALSPDGRTIALWPGGAKLFLFPAR